MKPLFRDYDMGDGFKIVAHDMRTWTQYEAAQQNAEGYVVNGRCAYFCRRREADAQIEVWKRQDKPPAFKPIKGCDCLMCLAETPR